MNQWPNLPLSTQNLCDGLTTRTDERPSGHQACLEQSVPWSATSIVTRNRVLAACLSLLICADWAFVSWRASQEFPGTSRESQRLVMSLLSLQRDFPGSRTGRRRREARGLACDVGPSSHSLYTQVAVPRPGGWWDEGLGYKDRPPPSSWRQLPRLLFLSSFSPACL